MLLIPTCRVMGELGIDVHVEELRREKKRKSASADGTEVKVKKTKTPEDATVTEATEKPSSKKKFFREKPNKGDVNETDKSEKKEKKKTEGAKKKALKEKEERKDKLARRAEKKEDKENAEKARKKEKKKSKFSISLSVGEKGEEAVENQVAKSSSSKGPRIIIAKEKTEKDVKKLSKRKQKKQKREDGGLNTGSESSTEKFKGKSKALEYLKTWSEDRDSWKFEKCRQIWLINHSCEPSLVPETIFPALLLYLASIKGGMREVVLRAARAKVESYVRAEEGAEAGLGEAEVSEDASDRALGILEALKEEAVKSESDSE